MGEFEVGGIKFEWDDEKAKLNVKKHEIYFEDAALVFFDNNAIYYEDDEHSIGEERLKIVGMVKKVADKKERNDYYGQFDFN